jgi:hypothetical protein
MTGARVEKAVQKRCFAGKRICTCQPFPPSLCAKSGLDVVKARIGWNILNCLKHIFSVCDRSAPALGTFHFVRLRSLVGGFLCRANRHPPYQSIEREYILACRSEIPCAWEAELRRNCRRFSTAPWRPWLLAPDKREFVLALAQIEGESLLDLIGQSM